MRGFFLGPCNAGNAGVRVKCQSKIETLAPEG